MPLCNPSLNPPSREDGNVEAVWLIQGSKRDVKQKIQDNGQNKHDVTNILWVS